MTPEQWTMGMVLAVFAGAAVVIGYFGTKLTRAADKLADVTGMGEALMGGIFLGGSTSISGIVTSMTAAWQGHAQLAISNSLGSIAAHMMFLGIADIVYRKANLEHAASSLPNMTLGGLLIVLLTVPLLAMSAPEMSVLGVNPVSFVLIAAYLFGVQIVSKTHKQPMWKPHLTAVTQRESKKKEKMSRRDVTKLWATLFGCAIVVALSGYVVGRTGIVIAERTGISEAIVGGLFTALVTALPELVTAIAAVRQGALVLAVGGILGGSCFDVLFISFADIAYRDGSIYHAITQQQVFQLSTAIMLTGILLMGLLRREKHGIGNIGFESVAILGVYCIAFAVLTFGGF
jgi:cation:H+ antiporter